AMSGEQRKKLVAVVKKSAEAAKVSCRNVRRDGNKHFDTAEKDKEMTEDDRDAGKEQMQTLLKTYEGQVEQREEKKAKESMEPGRGIPVTDRPGNIVRGEGSGG